MVNDFAIVLGLIRGEDGLEGAEAGAGVFVVEENAPGVQPHRGALPGGDLNGLHGREAVEHLLYAEPGDEQESKEKDEAAGEDMAAAGAAQQRDQKEQADLDAEAHDTPTRGGKEERADRKQRADGDDEPAFAANLAENERHERNGYHQLDESGKVIAVDVWAEGNSAVAHLAEPVEFPVEGELLENAERGDEKTENHDEPDVAAPIVGIAEGLRGEKEDEDVGDEEVELHARVVSGGGGAQEQLAERYGGQQDERRKQRRDVDALLVVALVEIKEKGPKKEEKTGAGFDDGARPVFDSAVREDTEDYESANAEAEKLHVAGPGDGGGDLGVGDFAGAPGALFGVALGLFAGAVPGCVFGSGACADGGVLTFGVTFGVAFSVAPGIGVAFGATGRAFVSGISATSSIHAVP